jgi:methionyl-tRNA formyltransferase
MRIVFFGSPGFALPTLDALLASGHDVVAVVCQPDRPAGRGHAPTPPPVKVAALARGLTVLQPANVSAAEPVEELKALEPDAFVVAAYGQILRRRLLDVPRLGTLNVHASLLPRHRGASPIAAAIINGDEVTGVTIMEMVLALDAGPMLARVEEAIAPSDTTGTLERRLALAGAVLLAGSLDTWAAGELKPEPQDESRATYAPQIKRVEAELNWRRPAVELWRRVRAYSPWPIAFTRWRGEELRIIEAWPLETESDLEPGSVLGTVALPDDAEAPGEETFAVQTGAGALAIRRLQRPGRRAMSGLEFLRGQRELAGSRLGQ